MKFFSKESNRAYVYRIALALLPVLVAIGVLSDEMLPLVIGLIAAILPTTLAVQNTSTVEE